MLEQNQQLKVNFDYNFWLGFYPDKTPKNYGIKFRYEKNGKEQLAVHYRADVCFLENKCVTVSKHDIYINNKPPELMIERLAQRITRVLNPSTFLYNKEGTLGSLQNQNQIKEKWKTLKKDIQNYYRGVETESTLVDAEKVIANKKQLEHYISQDLFFQLFFSPLYLVYTAKLKQDKVRPLSVLPSEPPFSFSIQQEVSQLETRSGKVTVTMTGSLNNIQEGITTTKSDLQLTYKLHKRTHQIFSIEGTISITKKNGTQHTVNINIYETQEKGKTQTKENPPSHKFSFLAE
ncbi:MAG: hypothetical protein ACK5IC_09035 [Moheibacter sp.]